MCFDMCALNRCESVSELLHDMKNSRISLLAQLTEPLVLLVVIEYGAEAFYD